MLATLLAAVLVVSAGGPFTSIDAALDAAGPGDVIEVRGGTHPAVVIDKPVTLRGTDGAILDGGEVGDVVVIEAPDVTLEGFRIQHSGRTLDQESAGVTVLAPRAIVRDNVLTEVLFGVFLKHAEGTVVQGNTITGYDYETARRGDGLRAWYSAGAQFLDNTVTHTRDVILWFSDDAVIARNHVTDGRYGLHFMYDDGMLVADNEIADNSVGMFLMYSSNVEVRGNRITDSTGPSGYGIGLKELANLTVRDNVLLRNRIGISLDTTPHGIDAFARFSGNLVAFNHTGLSFQPSTKRVELIGNSFDRNGSQIGIRGGGDLEGNVWSDERGNYWSDYAGYDAAGDGIGDLPYEAQSLFASLRDERPTLALFNYSPAAQAVDFAARAVPSLRPSPRVTDFAPLMDPPLPAWLDQGENASPQFLALAAALAAAAAFVTGSAMFGWPRGPLGGSDAAAAAPTTATLPAGRPTLTAPLHAAAPPAIGPQTAEPHAIVLQTAPPMVAEPVGSPERNDTEMDATEGIAPPLVANEPMPDAQTEAPPPPHPPILRATGLTKRYGDRAVLQHLDLAVRPGESVALWGGNGAGKTTALRCLLGVVHHEGEVEVDGVTLRDDAKGVRARIGYVPQEQQLPDIPGRDILRAFAGIRRVDYAEATAAATRVGMEAHLGKRPSELSGGLRQRLALALALLGAPPVLLLDEPTANLDEATRDALLGDLARLRDSGTALLFTTHRADEVLTLADRVITLRDGELIDDQDVGTFAQRVATHAAPLLLRVAPEHLDAATGILRAADLATQTRAGWLLVVAPAPDRAFRALWDAGIDVLDSTYGDR